MEYLTEVVGRIDSTSEPAEINRLLDELAFLYDAVEPHAQHVVDQLIGRLTARLELLRHGVTATAFAVSARCAACCM